MGKNQILMIIIGNLLPMLPSTYSFRGRLQRSSCKSSNMYAGVFQRRVPFCQLNGLFGPGKGDKKAVFVAVLGKKCWKAQAFQFLDP